MSFGMDQINGVTREHLAEELVKAPSGATSSKLYVRYDLIPPAFITRLAVRYALGISKGHSEYNWRKGIADSDFIQTRINHLEHHWNTWKKSGCQLDDNIGAVAWGLAFLTEVEHSPEGAKALEVVRQRMNNERKEELPDVSYRATNR